MAYKALKRIKLLSLLVILFSVHILGSGGLEGKRVIDSFGREISLPEKINRIISVEPEITRIIFALGAGSKLAGIDFFMRYHDYLFPSVFPEIKKMPLVSNAGQELNMEIIAAMQPDLIFMSPSEFQPDDRIEKRLGVPVAVLASAGRINILLKEINLLGDILGHKEKARELVVFFQDEISQIKEKISALSEKSRPRVFLTFWGDLQKTPVYYDPVELAGGYNVASGLLPAKLGTSGTAVNLEKILLWNPDIILIHGNYRPEERRITVEKLLDDTRLSGLKAVREKRVYYTFGFWYWWDPALVLVEIKYLAWLFWPELFTNFDLEREGNTIFEKIYGIKNAFSEIYKILGCYDWVKK